MPVRREARILCNWKMRSNLSMRPLRLDGSRRAPELCVSSRSESTSSVACRELLGRQRRAIQEALELIARILAQERELLVRFDALGDDLQAQIVSERDYRAKDRRIVR